MTTLEKLMSLAEAYAAEKQSDLQVGRERYSVVAARQALEAELTRLLTPLSDAQMDALCIEAGNQLRNYCAGVREELPLSVGRLVEQAHGMGTVVIQPMPELTSTAINDACWKFVEKMPVPLPASVFNNVKEPLHAAVCEFLLKTGR